MAGRRPKMMVQLFSEREAILPQPWKAHCYCLGTNVQVLYQFSVQGLGLNTCEKFDP